MSTRPLSKNAHEIGEQQVYICNTSFFVLFCLLFGSAYNLPCHCERFHSHHVYIHAIEREKPIYFFAKSCVWHQVQNKCLRHVNRSVGILRCVVGLTTVYQTPVHFIYVKQNEREKERQCEREGETYREIKMKKERWFNTIDEKKTARWFCVRYFSTHPSIKQLNITLHSLHTLHIHINLWMHENNETSRKNKQKMQPFEI